MNKIILAVALIAGATTSAFAITGDLADKAMRDLPGVNQRGITANPTSQPETGSLTDKAMRDLLSVSGRGRTANPTAKPSSGSLADKAMRDQLGS